MFKNMGGNISGGDFPGGNFPGGSLMGANFPGGRFRDTRIYNTHHVRCYHFFIFEVIVEFDYRCQNRIENYYHHDGEQLLF